jgi:hypothetical protein
MIFVSRLFLMLFLLALWCCSPQGKSAAVIKKEKMVQIMTEVYLIEMHYQKSYGMPSMYKPRLDIALDAIFKKHQVTRKDYESSFSYYASNPKEFSELNELVIQRYNEELVDK